MVLRRGIGLGMLIISILFSYILYCSPLWSVMTLQHFLIFAFFILTLELYGFGLLLQITLFRSRLLLHSLITFGCALLILLALGSGEGFVAVDRFGHTHRRDAYLLKMHLIMLEMGVFYLFLPIMLWLPISHFVAILRTRTRWWFEMP